MIGAISQQRSAAMAWPKDLQAPGFRNDGGGFPIAPAAAAADDGGPLPGMMSMRFGDPVEELPQEAIEKFRTLQLKRDEAGTLVRAAVADQQELRLTVQRHEARIKELQTPRGIGGFNLADDAPQVTDEQRKLDRARGNLRRVIALSEARGAVFRNIGALVRNIEAAVATPPSGCVAKMVAVDPPAFKGNIADAIEGRRRRGRELQSDLAKVRAAPWPSGVARRKMRERIGHLAEAGRPTVEQAIDHDAPIEFQSRHDQVQILNGDPALIGFASTPDAVSLLAWLFQDELVSKLDVAIDQAADDGIAMTHQQRREAEAQVLADLLAVEREECALVDAAQSQGLQIDYRPETDALAILSIAWIAAPPRVPREGDGEAGLVRHIGG